MDNYPVKQRQIFKTKFKKEIYEKFLLLGDGPAAWFKDACKILDDETKLDTKAHLVAHCYREIDSALRNLLIDDDFEHKCIHIINDQKCQGKPNENDKCSSCGISFSYRKSEIDEICLEFSISNTISTDWMNVSLHKIAHRNSLDKPRELNNQFIAEFEFILHSVLVAIEENYQNFSEKIIKIINKRIPEATKELRNKIPHSLVIYQYIFNQKEIDVSWLSSLKKNKFFDYPPEPINHENGGISFPYWPQLDYLERVAKESTNQKEVQKVLSEIETDNSRVQTTIAKIGSGLADIDQKLIDKIIFYTKNKRIWLLPENFADFSIALVKQKKVNQSFSVLENILQLVPEKKTPFRNQDPQGLFHNYQYEEILKKISPIFLEICPKEFILFLIKKLREGLEIRLEKKGVTEDYSYIWHSAIEDHNQNHYHSIMSFLILHIRDASESFIKNKGNLDVVLNLLNQESSAIYKRIYLHLLRKYALKNDKRIENELAEESNFENVNLHHEYYLLAQERGNEISPKAKKSIEELVNTKPDRKNYMRWQKKMGYEPDENSYQEYAKHRKILKLAIFTSTDTKFKQEYDRLIQETDSKEPKHPDFVSYTESGSWGYKSPFSLMDLKKKSHDELLMALNGWKPNKDNYRESDEGVARQIQQLVEEDAANFIENINTYKKIKKIRFKQGILNAVQNKVKSGVSINWKKILDFAQNVMSDCLSSNIDENTNWCLKTILSLIEEGFRNENIPLSEKETVWNLIHNLSWHQDPTTKIENTSLSDPNSEAYNLAINTVRGQMLHTAIRYGLWIKNQSKNDNLNELKSLLNDHLDFDKEPSLAVHSGYGQFLPQLVFIDKKWTKQNLDKVFPKEKKLSKYRESAWQAYIVLARPYKEVLSLVKDEYEFAIKNFDRKDTEESHLGSPSQNLANHLAIFYWNGILKLDDNLIRTFFDKENSTSTNRFVQTLGNGLEDIPKITSELEKRLIEFWNFRKQSYQKQLTTSDREELRSFGLWFISGKLNEKLSLEILEYAINKVNYVDGEHKIMEQLFKMHKKQPNKVLELAKLAVRGVKNDWQIHSWINDLEKMISISSKVKQEAIVADELASLLFSKGYTQFS